LLERDNSLNTQPRDQVRVIRRSADHLSGLIDGILDISKIQAGRLYLSRDEVRLSEFLDQLVDMFRVQAAAKGIDFVFKRSSVLPVVVYADEKRGMSGTHWSRPARLYPRDPDQTGRDWKRLS
jgi:signal transduction histidine kinase